MKVGIFDLETSSFYADSGIILCSCVKGYGEPKSKIVTVRADRFPAWKTNKSNEREFIVAVMKSLDKYDILVAHNGQFFDKGFLNAKCLQYGLPPALRWKKLVDPVLLSRRHLKLGRNTLNALIDYLGVKTHKTPIELDKWIKASHDGDKASMDLIVRHCVKDIVSLEEVYDKVRGLVDKIDKSGSSY